MQVQAVYAPGVHERRRGLRAQPGGAGPVREQGAALPASVQGQRPRRRGRGDRQMSPQHRGEGDGLPRLDEAGPVLPVRPAGPPVPQQGQGLLVLELHLLPQRRGPGLLLRPRRDVPLRQPATDVRVRLSHIPPSALRHHVRSWRAAQDTQERYQVDIYFSN